MKPSVLLIVSIVFGILGSIFLGLVAGLANVVTNQYIDNSLPGNPIVQEYDFRLAGKYGWISIFLLTGGIVLAIGGNTMGIYALFEYQASKYTSKIQKERKVTKKSVNRLLEKCPQCKGEISPYYNFCPECGANLR